LKNVASVYPYDAEPSGLFRKSSFRSDALKLIGESAAKIDATISRLSSFKKLL